MAAPAVSLAINTLEERLLGEKRLTFATAVAITVATALAAPLFAQKPVEVLIRDVTVVSVETGRLLSRFRVQSALKQAIPFKTNALLWNEDPDCPSSPWSGQ